MIFRVAIPYATTRLNKTTRKGADQSKRDGSIKKPRVNESTSGRTMTITPADQDKGKFCMLTSGRIAQVMNRATDQSDKRT